VVFPSFVPAELKDGREGLQPTERDESGSAPEDARSIESFDGQQPLDELGIGKATSSTTSEA